MIVPDGSGRPAERIPFPIKTERLVLRRFQTLDAKDLADLMSNPDTLRYLAWTPMTLEEAEEWIADQGAIGFSASQRVLLFRDRSRPVREGDRTRDVLVSAT